METKWQNYAVTLSKELGESVSSSFITNLINQSNGSEVISSGFFYDLGKTWAPLINMWASWIKNKAIGKSTALVLRDAKPLEVLASTKDWKKLYINRQNCGVPDELSGDLGKQPHPLLNKYLEQNHCSEYFTFVDSGCYGTIVLELHELGINFQPLFFFSKNPNIPGFLNEIGVTENEGEVLNDSLECAFPNIFDRPESFEETNGIISVCLKESDYLSVLFGKAALSGLEYHKLIGDENPVSEIKKLLKLSEQARNGKFTGILGQASPEWSNKKAFLEKWPKKLHWH